MAVSRLYRKGAPVNIKFRIEGNEDNAANWLVEAKVYDAQGNAMSDNMYAQIAGNMVNLSVPPASVKEIGDYIALFKIYSGQDNWELPIYFCVSSPEAIKMTEGLPVSKLTKESTPNQLESAISETLRALRKHMDAHEALKLATNTARMKTDKDLIPTGLIQREIKSALKGLKITVTL
jgi:hypothetical protein